MTPQGELVQTSVHRLIGYQVAQASVRTLAVFDREVGQPLDLKPATYTLLALVHDNPGVSPSRVAQALSLPAPTVTLQADRLQSRGWLRRERSDADRRAQQLWLTPEGASACQEASRRLLAAERRALKALSDGERLLLAELLHKLSACDT
jgi:DNA-binding MarR family transcriptional regulator